MKPLISLVQYAGSPGSLREAVELCSGLEKLERNTRVLIKPNLITWDDQFKIAPFGVFTTTRLVEDMVIMLKDHGCREISIGEGSVQIQKGIGTMAAFTGLGYISLVKKYGVKLVDFNAGKSVDFKIPGGPIFYIAREAMESDFLINFPVLKTHAQTKVSLGLKNLKGCLKTSSKKICHHASPGLEYCFTFIADCIKPALTIVDGIYALERGPLHFGNAFRKGVIVAARDALENHIKALKWDWGWAKDNTGPSIFEKFGVTGVTLPKYDETLCSGCTPLANMVNILVLSAFTGQPLPKIEILNGKKMQARSGYDSTVLIGDCIIKANKENVHIRKAIRVAGCPPDTKEVIDALKEAELHIDELAYWGYLKQQGEKYDNQEGYSWDFYR